MGVNSLPVVVLTGACIGAVFASQIHLKFSELGMSSGVGPVVAYAMCRELGPIICGLMIAARVGASISTELGSMKTSEQVDALRSMAVYPTDYLVVPRLIALLLSMPLLVSFSIFFGIIAGYVICVPVLGVEPAYYIHNSLRFTGAQDVGVGLIKSVIFGFVICTICCERGLNCGHGAQGVGKATTEAVVSSTIALLVCNFFTTFLLNAWMN
jgi:phospholipid/cholesterol/gamma-HCH transport system permease protein